MMKSLVLALFIAAAGAPFAHSALVASDNAGNYSTWSNGDNQGTGFGAWQLDPNPNNGNAGFFVGDSSGNGTPTSGNINTAGKAWGLYANSGNTASAVRPFTGGALAPGAQFLIQLDNGNIQNGGTVGFGLQNGSGANRFEFYFVGGQSAYTINVGGSTINTGISFTDDGLSLVFSQESANDWSLDVTPAGGSTSHFSSAVSGFDLASSDISQVRLFNFNAGSGGGADAFYNSIQVVPEPVNVALGVFGVTALCSLGFRRLFFPQRS